MCSNTQRIIGHNTVRIELHPVRILTHANCTLPRNVPSYMKITFSECKKLFVPCQFADSPLCLAYGTHTYTHTHTHTQTSWQSCAFFLSPREIPSSVYRQISKSQGRNSYNMNHQDALFFKIYFNSKPLHVLSRLAAHHQEDHKQQLV